MLAMQAYSLASFTKGIHLIVDFMFILPGTSIPYISTLESIKICCVSKRSTDSKIIHRCTYRENQGLNVHYYYL